MSESFTYHKRSGTHVSAHRHTRQEIRDAWNADPALPDQVYARQRGGGCIVIPTSNEEEALALAAFFHRRVYADIRCTHWDGESVSLYYPTSYPLDWKSGRRKVLAFFLDPDSLDERGPLFAQEVP